jgi:hypothetical protein
MRKLLILLLLLIPLAGFSHKNHRAKVLPVSRWREVKRMLPDSTVVPFTDTMFMSFMQKQGFSYHNKNGFIYNGTYKLEGDYIDFGTAHYNLVTKRPTSITLANETGIFVFNTDSTDTLKAIILAKKDSSYPVTSIDQMIGHWSMYKRTTKDSTNTGINEETAISSLYITGPSTDGREGYIYGDLDAKNRPSWYIKNLGADQSLDCDGKNLRIIKVLRCQNGEMILEENNIKYYFKQFK